MFERYGRAARRVVVLAEREARALHHDYIGSAHLLLGLLAAQEGIAARVLEGVGVSADAVRERMQPGQAHVVPSSIPFTPEAKLVFTLSESEARRLANPHTNTGHMLLGLLLEGRGAAVRLLSELGVSVARLRHDVAEALERESEETPMAVMPLDRYLREVEARPDLSVDEETRQAQAVDAGREAMATLLRGSVELTPQRRDELWRRAHEGLEARRTLLEANLRLVARIASAHATSEHPLSDLVREGNVRLQQALEAFDWRVGQSFSEHAAAWVSSAMPPGERSRAGASRIEGTLRCSFCGLPPERRIPASSEEVVCVCADCRPLFGRLGWDRAG